MTREVLITNNEIHVATRLFRNRKTKMNRVFVCLVVVMVLACVTAFNAVAGRSLARAQRTLKMEYIPDGMSKAQWEKVKQKEAETIKNKNLGAVGITKFKSRSFEAFQKSGAKNLFPVDKDTPMDQRPYMMRPGGQPDGSDLVKKGLVGKGQATAAKIVAADEKYEKLAASGQLKSTPFAIPWTSSAAASAFSKKKDPVVAVAPTKKGGVPVKPAAKSATKPAAPAAAPPAEEKKKGFFGLF